MAACPLLVERLEKKKKKKKNCFPWPVSNNVPLDHQVSMLSTEPWQQDVFCEQRTRAEGCMSHIAVDVMLGDECAIRNLSESGGYDTGVDTVVARRCLHVDVDTAVASTHFMLGN